VRVLMVSTSYPADADDWRGVFIRHMAEAIAQNRAIHLRLWAPPGELPADVQSSTTLQEAKWLGTLMARGGISHLVRTGRWSALWAPITLLRMMRRAYARSVDIDAYHINWLQCALPLPKNDVPALLTVLGNDLKLLKLPGMRALLRRKMRGRRVAVCPNADWMVPQLADAFGDVASVKSIPFGIGDQWYAVKRKPDPDSPQWLAVTRLTADKIGSLFDWSAPLFNKQRRQLHLFGPMQESMIVPPWVVYHGAATPNDLCTNWFPRATGLITLSRHAEGKPQVMLEAMAAGIPIVASDIPAHRDIVDDGRSGLLCATADAYAGALDVLERPLTNAAFGEYAYARCREEFGTWRDCARRYVAIYEELLQT
jgi:glycosyltransferase involved in cell wall biosynthesis